MIKLSQTIRIEKTNSSHRGNLLFLSRKQLKACLKRFHRIECSNKVVYQSYIIRIWQAPFSTYVTLKTPIKIK